MSEATWRGRLWWLSWMTRYYVTWPWRTWVEPPLAAWLVRWHGQGEPQQAQVYRCQGCQRLVTHWLIGQGGCGCGLSNKLSPAQLSVADKARLLALPWTLRRPGRGAAVDARELTQEEAG